MKSDLVPSPCFGVCALNENDHCTGCYRSAKEITEWSGLDSDQRREVLKLSQERRKEDGGGMFQL